MMRNVVLCREATFAGSVFGCAIDTGFARASKGVSTFRNEPLHHFCSLSFWERSGAVGSFLSLRRS